MPVESGSDRLALLQDFGVSVVIGGSSYTGIFDADHDQVSGGEVSFSVQEAMVAMRTEDVASVGQGTEIEVDGRDYVVTDLQPDGTGMTTLMLEEL